MKNCSNSTKLLNCIIALATKNPDFPHPFFDSGYQIETIEPKFLLKDARQVNPDIQLKKNSEHLLFFECKDGHAEKDQLERYKSLTIDDIKRAKITSLPTDEFSYDLAYFCTKEKEDKISASISLDANPFPIVILDKCQIYRNADSNEFGHLPLNQMFGTIGFNSPIPESYIPFTVDDKNEVIIIYLLQHFMTKYEYEFTLDQLLEDLFSHLIHLYSEQAKGVLKNRLGNILKDLLAQEEFEEELKYNKTTKKYILLSNAPKKFQKTCQKYIEKCMENSEQTNLTQYY